MESKKAFFFFLKNHMLFITKSSMLEIWLRSEFVWVLSVPSFVIFSFTDNNDYVRYEIRFRLMVDMMFQSVKF